MFPQLEGLGRSLMCERYGIRGMGEAEAYLDDETLRGRLVEISQALLELGGDDPVAVMGPVDALKLRSCMTLFSLAEGADPAFRAVIDKYYAGEPDPLTLGLLGRGGSMTRPELVRTSRFIALVLRHKPQAAGIELDEHGWADVGELIDGVNVTGRHRLDMPTLEEIVATDEKGRYSFDGAHARIRANQGHSVPVDVGHAEETPPDVLFHGTAERFCDSIRREGLLPMSRLYVHLSTDVPTAVKVGSWHGKPTVWRVDGRRMAEDGLRFYLSENGVWLTERVPPEYLSREDGADTH